ncbi:MAG: class I SAM-dependent methyltransferase [Thermoflexales bacterium]|nr:class I SAM-dependent methyltransferase [Thermoflexales bacterium]
MDKVKQHFEEEAREYDGIILRIIPHYPYMIEALISAIPFEAAAPIRAIDLGCGTGTVARRVLEAFPRARMSCVDLAENMLGMARAKLADYPHIRYIPGDFNHLEFDQEYDVVVSSLALHHLVSDQDKRGFYRKVYDTLAPGGVFYNADVVLGSSAALQDMYMDKWRAFMRQKVSDEEIETKWLPKYRAEDRPARLSDQLAWLAETGFAGVDVVWKYYNYAVYGGNKP